MLKLLTMDDSTLATRKDAANRDKQYDLRTLVNHQISERNCTFGFGLKYAWFGIILICQANRYTSILWCLELSTSLAVNDVLFFSDEYSDY